MRPDIRLLASGGLLDSDIATRYRIPVKDRYTLELFGRLENIADRTYYEAGYQTPGIWGTAGVRWRF